MGAERHSLHFVWNKKKMRVFSIWQIECWILSGFGGLYYQSLKFFWYSKKELAWYAMLHMDKRKWSIVDYFPHG